MLKELQIRNIILMESASIVFGKGLHAFSGETGAGKTAILQALNLILGAKADTQIIRNDCESASVTALFELENPTFVNELLTEGGIEVEEETPLIIKREITINGKSKLYINNQLCQLSLLKQIAPHLLEIVEQHASQKLFDIDYHRKLLDLLAKHKPLAEDLSSSFHTLHSLQEDLRKIKEKEENERKLKQEWSDIFEEIDSARIQSPDEEIQLFDQYEELSKSQELYESLSKVYHTLQEQEASVIQSLRADTLALDKIKINNPEFKRLQENLHEAVTNLTDLSFDILKFRDSIDDNPEKINALNERLKLLRTLCKRYGPTLSQVIEKKEQLSSSLNQFEELSEKQKNLSHSIEQEQKRFQKLCDQMSQARALAKESLEKQIKAILAELNLPNAEFIIELTPIKAGAHGQEAIEFFLKANKGEKRVSLKEGVSGGELSRLLLALKVILFELEEIPSLIFDEVDANLGGETAPKIGKLLKKMSQKKQILIITHLPQVAVFADHHYKISKKEEGPRTYSSVQLLNEKEKQKEIERMLGGTDLSKKASILAEDLLHSSKR